MLNLFLLSSVLVAQQGAAPVTGKSLVEKMFARYYSAKTLTASVKTTQTAGTTSILTETSLNYERPAKIRLDQVQHRPSGDRSRTMISDGVHVVYTPPDRLITRDPFLAEPVKSNAGVSRTLADLYPLTASDLPDRSPVLDALIARSEDMRYFWNQLASANLMGRVTIAGKEANEIIGDWRETEMRNQGDADRHIGDTRYVRDTYKLYITDAGDLVRYEIIQHFASPPIAERGKPVVPGQQILVTTAWDVNVVVDAPIRPETFALKTR